MKLHAGTSGFSFKEWKGHFYPEDLPAKGMLGYYAERLPAVEVNNTFYRMPKPEVLRSWCEQVPETFRFAVKASQRITHRKRLEDVGEDLADLLGNLEVMGERLGAVLFQLPPNLKKDVSRLDACAERLRGGPPAVFEFRNESWRDEDVYDVLRSIDAAVCLAQTDEEPEPPLVETASWGYLRMRREHYDDETLGAVLARLETTRWERAFVFLKHEIDGPRHARRLLELAGG